jgi:UDP-galactopyranose mutase
MSIKVVGSGLFGATCARLLADKGYDVQVFEQRPVVAGNCYDEEIEGVLTCKHGVHVFHTNLDKVWDFVNRFAEFNDYVHRVLCYVDGQYISFPPNEQTYQQLGTKDVSILLDGYSKKMWGDVSDEWLNTVQARIPIRFNDDDRYFADKHQGMPIGGYTQMVEKMLAGIPVNHRKFTLQDVSSNDTVIYSGSIDELFDYQFGKLDYRSLSFLTVPRGDERQPVAVVNYPSLDTPCIRTVDYSYFYNQPSNQLLVYEYPEAFNGENERYYPINDTDNLELYGKYLTLLPSNVIVGGRLGSYQYLNMDQVILRAFDISGKF